MAAIEKYTVPQIADALKKTAGFISLAAEQLGCNPGTIYDYFKKYPELEVIRNDLKLKRDDICKSMIMKGIREGNTALIIFYAKTQMGWTENSKTGVDTTLTIKHEFANCNEKNISLKY